MKARWVRWGSLVGMLAVTFAIAGVGGVVSRDGGGQWYAALAKPAWTPPAWVFGPVWTVLYGTMAVAAWGVWRRWPAPPARAGLTLYFVQLAFNAAWSPLFFGLRQPLWALVDLCALWVAIVLTTRQFLKAVPWAGAAMLPYLGWVTFAGYLNGAIWWLNRG